MSRIITTVMTADQRRDVLRRLDGVPGVMAVIVQEGGSRTPAGDVLTLHVSNDAARLVLSRLGEAGVLDHGIVTLGEPTALIAPGGQMLVDRETNEAAWEEVAALLRRDTNVGVNFLLLMAASGAIAALGITAGTTHIVVGAMLLAPGFEPVLRIAFGALTGGGGTGVASGIRSTFAGYAALAAGAAAAVLAGAALDGLPPGGLRELSLVRYWTGIGPTGLLVSVLASVAGAAVVTSRRTVFAAGVMVALGLVPGAAIAGMGLVLGEWDTALMGLARWGAEAACVLAAGGLTLALKRRLLHARRVEA